jgi:hypothetical protein
MTSVRQLLATSAAACLVAACGGGGVEPLLQSAPVTQIAITPAPTHVRIEGCVLDVTDRPLALPVHAVGADGRLLGSVMTDNAGVFRMHVPARAVVTLAAATPAAEPMTVLTGSTDLTVAACLRPALA